MNYLFFEKPECHFCGTSTNENKILGLRLNKSQGLNPKNKTGIAVSVIKCKKCSLIYSNPQPVPVNIQDHYGIPPENYWKEEYFSVDENYFSDQIKIAKKLIDFTDGMDALDIGAGLGKCMISLNSNGFNTFGIEPSITFRDKAIEKMKIDPEKIKLGMVEEVDFPEESFDFITFGAVLEHLYNPAEAIEKTLKWLKPNGVIQIEVPSSKWLIPKFFNFYFKLRRTNYVTNLSPMHEPFHMFEFDLNSFKELSKSQAFDIAHHEYMIGDIYHMPKFIHPLLRWYMKVTNRGMQLTVYLKRRD